MDHATKITAAREAYAIALAWLETVNAQVAELLPAQPAEDAPLDEWDAWDDVEVALRDRFNVRAAERAKTAAEDALMRATRAGLATVAATAEHRDALDVSFAGALGEPRRTGGKGINFKARRKVLDLCTRLDVGSL